MKSVAVTRANAVTTLMPRLVVSHTGAEGFPRDHLLPEPRPSSKNNVTPAVAEVIHRLSVTVTSEGDGDRTRNLRIDSPVL